MKKILIFSLCGLFSLDDASGMEIVELLNPENPSASELFSAAILDTEKSPIVCVKGDEENVKLIQAAVCWRDAKLRATLGNNFCWLEFVGKRLLFNTGTKQIQELGPGQEKVFTQVFTQLCERKGEVTVATIADALEKNEKNVYRYLSGGRCDSLKGTGMKISSVGGEIQTNMGTVSIEPPDSTRTVRIPLTKAREIIGPSGTVKILRYENVNEVPTQALHDSSKISYFIDINGKLQRVGYRDANLLFYLSKLKPNTQFTAGDIIAQSTVNGEKVFSEGTVYPYISRVSSWLEECGLEIKTIIGKGYEIQKIGGAKRAIEERTEVIQTIGETVSSLNVQKQPLSGKDATEEPDKKRKRQAPGKKRKRQAPARTQGDCESNPFGGYIWLAESIQKAL